MNLYSTITSERTSKGQGGNKFLDIQIFTTDRTQPTHQIHVFNSTEEYGVVVKMQEFYFGEWRDKYQDTILLDSQQTNGEQQKGEK